jgi:hypothetical protein
MQRTYPTNRKTVISFGASAVIAIGVLWPLISFAGPKAYDLSVLVRESHPVANQNASRSVKSDAKDPPLSSGRFAVTVFGGWMTDNDWEDVFTPWNLDFRDTTLVGVAGSRRIWRYEDKFSLEVEAQAVRYFGDQENWEFNLPVLIRWDQFPWDEKIDTSIAFGLGPSYASEVPDEEVAMDGDSQRWLVYWVAELAVGLPRSNWRGVFRLHHRSGAFGIVADEGGSNVLAVGLRRQF